MLSQDIALAGSFGYLRYETPYFHSFIVMTGLSVLFWISFSVLFFCYLGYGGLLYLINSVKKFNRQKQKDTEENIIPVTLIIPAYNEAGILKKKLENTFKIDYPSDKLRVIFVTEGSSDETISMLGQYPDISIIDGPDRKGKYAAINKAMHTVTTPVVVFSDANTLLNPECIIKLTAHYKNPAVGGVAGEKKIIRNSAVGEAEGLYWQYESFLKKQDAAFNTVIGAAGELFSIRTDLFKQSDEELLLDDFIISMQVCLQGYKIEYEPDAFATELPSSSLAEEEKRKIRIAAGAYQSIGPLKGCFNIFKHPLLSFQYISRRLLRWVCCPPLLFLLLLTNILMIWKGVPIFYGIFLVLQLLFYSAAIAGYLLTRKEKRAGIFTIPFYFVFMNVCLVKGFIRFVRGGQPVLWEKSRRQAPEL